MARIVRDIPKRVGKLANAHIFDYIADDMPIGKALHLIKGDDFDTGSRYLVTQIRELFPHDPERPYAVHVAQRGTDVFVAKTANGHRYEPRRTLVIDTQAVDDPEPSQPKRLEIT